MGGKRLKVVVPLAATNQLIVDLGNKVQKSHESAGQELPDIVSIPRTGLHIGPVIARMWGHDARRTLTAGVAKNEDGTFSDIQMPTSAQISGRRLLVVDGVCKSGETLQHTVSSLKEAGAISVKSAVLIHKTDEAAAGSGYVPDFFAEEDKLGAYNVFWWEIDEHMPTPTEQPMVSLPDIGQALAGQQGNGALPHGA
jgi:hypoxanthine phosphoribosyltransferase